MRIPQRNVSLFQRTLDHIHTHPEQHDQEFWMRVSQRPSSEGPQVVTCGTAACFAGWATLLAGYVPYSRIGDGQWPVEVVPTTASGRKALPEVVSFVAIKVLGISDAEADILFRASNTVSFLWHFSQLLCNGDLTLPAEVAQDLEAKDRALAEWNYRDPDAAVTS
jgi:hypothetical protein